MALGVSVPVITTSFHVFDPAPLSVIAPPIVVVDTEVNVPVTVTFPSSVASAPAFAIQVPGAATVNAPNTANGALLADSNPPAATVNAPDTVKLELHIPVPLTLKAPPVVNAMDEETFAPAAIVVVKKVVDTGVPVIVDEAPLNVNVPAVRLMVPLLTRLPLIVRLTAPLIEPETVT